MIAGIAGRLPAGGIGMVKQRRFELKLPEEQAAMVKGAAQAGGFRSPSAYIRAVLTRDLSGSESDRTDQEVLIAASIDRLSKEIRGLHTGQQALFATIDSLTRLFLTCVPEPPAEVLDQAKRRAKLRYDRFLVSVAQNMTADTRATLGELTDRG
jgi:Arc/MetJ-type ribon-helix-helix transcriptional regulator